MNRQKLLYDLVGRMLSKAYTDEQIIEVCTKDYDYTIDEIENEIGYVMDSWKARQGEI